MDSVLFQVSRKICDHQRILFLPRARASRCLEAGRDKGRSEGSHHLVALKAEMVDKKKLEAHYKADLRKDYVSWSLEECIMAFRLQNPMFDCRANMPSRYKRDLTCQACRPDPAAGLVGHVETQEQLELCIGYSELWLGLGPMTPQTVVRYFIKVRNKRKKTQQ